MRDLSLDDERRPARRLAGPLVEAGLDSAERLARLALARPLRRDHPPRCARPGPAGLAEAERYPELRPIKVNCVAVRGFTEQEIPALAELARRKPYVVRFIEFMPLDADKAWREDRCYRRARSAR